MKAKCHSGSVYRSDYLIKVRWDDDGSESGGINPIEVWVAVAKRGRHGAGTTVMRKSDGRRGVATTDHRDDNEITIRWDDDGSVSQGKRSDELRRKAAAPQEEGEEPGASVAGTLCFADKNLAVRPFPTHRGLRFAPN